jgi:PAS domain S-box-containing protein
MHPVRSACSFFAFAVVAFLFSSQLPVAAAEEVRSGKRVLIFNDVGTLSSLGIAAIDSAIHARLQKSPCQIEIFNESLETALFSDNVSQDRIRDGYFKKYEDRKPDVIVTVGPASLRFMVESHGKHFPGIPIIFCGGTREMLGGLRLDPQVTGVWGEPELKKSMDLVLHLRPATRHVVVVGNVGTFDRDVERLARDSFRKYASKLEFTYLTDLDMPALLDRLSHLPADTVVFHTSIMQDAAGAKFIDATESVPMVAGAANAPVFVFDDVDVGNGAIGGNVVRWAAQGRAAGRMVLRVLNGEKPENIPIIRTANINLFDWRALRRWGLSEGDLPAGSTLLYRSPTFWESYKWYIIPLLLVIFAQTALIFELFWLRAKRIKLQNELMITNDRLHLALECGGSVGWDWHIKSGRDRLFGDLPTMFGIPSHSYDGQVEDFFRTVHPEDRERVGKAVADARQNQKPYSAQFRLLRADGAVRWVTSKGKFYYAANKDAVRMLGVAVDITGQKEIEEALKKSEERFSKAFRQSPVCLTIMTAKDSRYIEVNETFEEITGWRRDEVIGRTPFDIGLWVDPGQRAALMERLLAEEPVRNIEFLARSKDGKILSGLGSAELIEINSELCVLSVSADITDLKRVEAILRESEARFRLVANSAPVMIWMSGTDKLCTYFNRCWLEFTGRSMETEMGDGWADGVHRDDLKQCISAYSKAFDRRESFRIEYRLRRFDGEYRWLLDSGVPRFNADGSFAGYIGSAIDVTDHKLAQEALSMVSRRLIEAQEEERTFIARELHDDISQRLALLALNLGFLRTGNQTSPEEIGQGITTAMKYASNLSSDLRALSHRLHSSKLDHLGLAKAAASYCHELSDQYKVEIEFHSEGIPDDLRAEIALCTFRVLQEALQNALRHSGSHRYKVSLYRISNDICMTVQDSGGGFDPATALRRGLGLSSMKERVKLVDGELSIESQPGLGTTVYVRVPLLAAARSARLPA